MDRLELAAQLTRATGISTGTPLRHLSPQLPAPSLIASLIANLSQLNEFFLGETAPVAPAAPPAPNAYISIQTGGSTGNPKWARHTPATLAAATTAFAQHFQTPRIDTLNILPLHHVSGLMPLIRSALTNGSSTLADWPSIRNGTLPAITGDSTFLSLVPAQLHQLLCNSTATDWLRRFRAILVGGSSLSPALLERAFDQKLPLSPSYGMTETAAMITALLPEQFLNNTRSSGTAFPNVQLQITTTTNALLIKTPSLFHGYYPHIHDVSQFWPTGDSARLDEHRHLHLLGRLDNLIITGGEKVNPLEIEQQLLATRQFTDIAILPAPHPKWTHQLIALYPATDIPNLPLIHQHLHATLPSYKHPKYYLPVPDWPRTPQGKLNKTLLLSKIPKNLS